MQDDDKNLAILLVSEMLTAEQLIRHRLARVLPKGMELSHYLVINYLATRMDESTPAQLAKRFHVTRGAMTNTLNKLEVAGHVHIRPDWDDARRKLVSISPAGRQARDAALAGMTPVTAELLDAMGVDKLRVALPIMRELRQKLEADD